MEEAWAEDMEGVTSLHLNMQELVEEEVTTTNHLAIVPLLLNQATASRASTARTEDMEMKAPL